MTVDTGTYLSALAADSEAFADLATDLDRPVPSCPDWNVADLVEHLGGVYSWVQLAVRGGGERPTTNRDQAPGSRAELLPWFLGQRSGALDALTAHEPDAPAWNFTGRTETFHVGWWRRRQAMETSIHLFDMEQAVGQPKPIAPDLAADGVDEMVGTFLPGYLSRKPVAGLDGTLHLHCTDADGEWILDFGGGTVEVRREHAKADAALRGPASDLFLWVWNRVSLDTGSFEVFGRREIAEALSQICF